MHILVSVILLFYFFTPCADIVNKKLAMQTIGQVVGIKLTTLIRHENEKKRSIVDDWKKFDIIFDDLC